MGGDRNEGDNVETEEQIIEKKSVFSSMDTAKFINKLHEDMPLNFDPLQMPLVPSNANSSLMATHSKLDINASENLDDTIKEFSKIKHNIK